MSSNNIILNESSPEAVTLFEAILSSLDSIVIVVNSNNKIIYCNKATVDTIGINSKEDDINQLDSLLPFENLFPSKKELKINNAVYYQYTSDINYFKQVLEERENLKISQSSSNSKNYANNYFYESEIYLALFQNSPFGLLFFNDDSIIIDCNSAFQNIFRLTKDQCIGINLFEKLQDQKLVKALNDMFNNGFGQYEDLYSSILDGKEIPIKIVLKRVIGTKGPIGGLAIVIDMTEKFRHYKILEQSENKYKTIFDSINDAILINDIKTGLVVECNDRACEMFQYSKEEIINKSIEQLSENISPFSQDDGKKFIQKAIFSGPQVFNWRAKKKDFSLFWVEVSLRVAKISNSKLVIVVIRDITERLNQAQVQDNLYKELEKKAFQLTKLNNELKATELKLRTLSENKDKFYSTISHDLRSPFLSILGYTEFLDKNLVKLTTSEIKDSLISLNLAISNVYTLIERLLEWSRTQSGEFYFHPKDLKLAEIFDNNIDILVKNANYKNIRIHNKVSEDITVTADTYMLNSVIRNLISNAIKFSYVNSEIIISSARDGDFEQIMIQDFGTGIDENIIPKLFSKKYNISTAGTYKETGTGLGMLLCKEWIEKNNGKLWLESKMEKGTTIYFTLPVSKISNE